MLDHDPFASLSEELFLFFSTGNKNVSVTKTIFIVLYKCLNQPAHGFCHDFRQLSVPYAYEYSQETNKM